MGIMDRKNLTLLIKAAIIQLLFVLTKIFIFVNMSWYTVFFPLWIALACLVIFVIFLSIINV